MMRRRHLLQSTLLGAPALVGAAAAKPNFLFLLADDLGYGDLSSYGAPDCRTPNIDSIGRQGVRFTRAYANAPECTPTRAAFLTARYQQRVGGLECAIGVGNVGRYDEAEWLAARGELGLPPSETSIARMLSQAGYDTCLSGKWHLGYLEQFHPRRAGFDEAFGILGGNANYFTHREESGENVLFHNERRVKRSGYLTDLITEHAVDWLKKRGRRPFFHYVAFTAPHTPLQGPGDANQPVSRENWNKGDRSTYVAMVNHMDKAVGAILEELDRMGAAENTVVVFMSDNGGYNMSRNAPLRGGKSSVYEGGLRVPCLARWPGVTRPGGTIRQVALTMDWSATFLAAGQATIPAGRQPDGIDLRPFLTGDRQPAPRTVFFRYKRGQNRRWAVIDGDWKYLRDGSQEGLYDLATDEAEQNNRISAMPEEARRLRAKLSAWEREVAAPRLRDFRPAPQA